MNIETGNIVPAKEFKYMPPVQKAKHIAIKRDLTKLERREMQIRKYSPCGCGSGKKFKFCCFRKKA